MTIQIVRNSVVGAIYFFLRLVLHDEPEQTRRSIIRVRKLRILLSLLTIPTWTAIYVDDIMTWPPWFRLPVSLYIASLAWLVFDVLREYNALVEVKKRTSKEDTIESSWG